MSARLMARFSPVRSSYIHRWRLRGKLDLAIRSRTLRSALIQLAQRLAEFSATVRGAITPPLGMMKRMDFAALSGPSLANALCACAPVRDPIRP